MLKIKNKTPVLVTTNNQPINATKIKSAFEGVTDADIDIIDSMVAVVRFGDVVVAKTSGDFSISATGVLDGGGDPVLLTPAKEYPRACLGNMLCVTYE